MSRDASIGVLSFLLALLMALNGRAAEFFAVTWVSGAFIGRAMSRDTTTHSAKEE